MRFNAIKSTRNGWVTFYSCKHLLRVGIWGVLIRVWSVSLLYITQLVIVSSRWDTIPSIYRYHDAWIIVKNFYLLNQKILQHCLHKIKILYKINLCDIHLAMQFLLVPKVSTISPPSIMRFNHSNPLAHPENRQKSYSYK
jgi:hypothetical protein